MKRLWGESVQAIDTGIVTEHAATIVWTAAGKVQLSYFAIGTPDGAEPSYHVQPDETCVGTYHTHPYENGLTGMSFSGPDIASAINRAEWISLVQSGADVFALIRTDKTPERVSLALLEWEVEALYAMGLQLHLAPPDALWIANLEMCATYGLAFYAGEADTPLEVIFKP